MIAGYILSGGKNRRMEGKPKLFLEYGGASFYEHIKRALAPFPEIYLSVEKGKEELYSALPLPKIADIYPDTGPLGGICSGLKLCRGIDALFVAACDTPLIRQEAVRRITEVYQAQAGQRKTAVVARTEEQVHPLFGIYPKTVLPVFEQMIAEQNYKMRELLLRAGAVKVPFTKISVHAWMVFLSPLPPDWGLKRSMYTEGRKSP